MLANKLGRGMIGGCHVHDDVQLSSSDGSRKASRNACKLCEGSNASINAIPTLKLVATNLVECL